MHEYAVAQSIVEIAVREAESAHAGRIMEIKLVIGDLSSIIDESLNMYFNFISAGTIAEGAKLVFKRISARFLCRACGHEYDKPVKGFDYPVCNGPGVLLEEDAGKEFYIESLEVDS